jgi:hypothetical protein
MKDILTLVRKNKGYAPPSSDERAAYREASERLAVTHKTPVPAAALLSAHGQERSLRARNRTSGVQWVGKIVAARGQGLSAVEIAEKFDLPPMFVLKHLRSKGGGVSERESLAAALADAGSALHQQKTKTHADKFELKLSADLTRLGIPHKTEDDLRREGSLLTPDLLLDPPVDIAGAPVTWVDAKNYMFYGNRLTVPGLKKQAKKYTEAFGPGVMVFAGGVACNAPELGAVLRGPDWLS